MFHNFFQFGHYFGHRFSRRRVNKYIGNIILFRIPDIDNNDFRAGLFGVKRHVSGGINNKEEPMTISKSHAPRFLCCLHQCFLGKRFAEKNDIGFENTVAMSHMKEHNRVRGHSCLTISIG